MKPSTYFFRGKTKLLADFQICVSVPLIPLRRGMMVIYEGTISYNLKSHIYFSLNIHYAVVQKMSPKIIEHIYVILKTSYQNYNKRFDI